MIVQKKGTVSEKCMNCGQIIIQRLIVNIIVCSSYYVYQGSPKCHSIYTLCDGESHSLSNNNSTTKTEKQKSCETKKRIKRIIIILLLFSI